MNWKSLFQEWVPLILASETGGLAGFRTRFSGDYKTWEEAIDQSGGYDQASILRRVRVAAKAIVDGDAGAERDGFLLPSACPSFPLIASALALALRNRGRVSILDFGGALGSTYYQCREFLAPVTELNWQVVEQASIAACGRAEFEDGILRFYDNIDDALASEKPDIALVSGVLQYVPNPQQVLDVLTSALPQYLLIDRTPFLNTQRHVLTKQSVPRRLGGEKYPAWLFRQDILLSEVHRKYELLHSFEALDGVMSYRFRRVEFKGFLFRRAD